MQVSSAPGWRAPPLCCVIEAILLALILHGNNTGLFEECYPLQQTSGQFKDLRVHSDPITAILALAGYNINLHSCFVLGTAPV
jgi:hypothetical protein